MVSSVHVFAGYWHLPFRWRCCYYPRAHRRRHLDTVTTASACNLVASPTGSDTASGTIAAPFQTVQKLVDSLTPGQTGCVETGTYDEDVRIAQGGVAGAPVTLAAYPGDSPTIVGRMEIVEGANYVTVTGLNLNGENPAQAESPIVDANNVTFSYDDVTNDDTGICFGIGSATWGWATGTLITHDRIHGCGQPNENYQHGLYIGARDRYHDRVEPDLRQRRPGDPAVPRRPAHDDRPQRHRRQRRGNPHLRRQRVRLELHQHLRQHHHRRDRAP